MNIVLTGFMGTGKTTVGRLLATRLGLDFHDMDELIEQEAGMTVPEIFSIYGEEHFRALEKKTVRDLVEGRFGDGLVVSAGGGAVVDDGNRALLRKWAVVVSLTATVDEILKRVGEGEDRPLLERTNMRHSVTELLRKREAAYRDADLVIDTTDISPDETAERIITYLDKKGLLESL